MSLFTAAEIHLWLAFYDEITDERLHSAYRELLNAAEREQEPRFYLSRRSASLSGYAGAGADRLVALRIHRSPGNGSFPPMPMGAPRSSIAQARDACLSFNISHTHGLIVLGVTRHRALGVDVENVARA